MSRFGKFRAEWKKKNPDEKKVIIKAVLTDALLLSGGAVLGGGWLLGASVLVGVRVQNRIEDSKRQKFMKSGEPMPAVLKRWGEKTKKERFASMMNWMVAGLGAYYLGYANSLAALGYVCLGEIAARHVAMREGVAYANEVNKVSNDKNLSHYQKKQILKSMAKKRVIPFLWMTGNHNQPKVPAKPVVVAKPAAKKVAVPVSAENIKTAAPHVKAKVVAHDKKNDVGAKPSVQRKTLSMAELDKFLSDKSRK